APGRAPGGGDRMEAVMEEVEHPRGATRVAAGALLRQAALGRGARTLPHLVVRTAGGPEQVVPLGDELTVGRGGQAGLRLADAAASRLHARLRLDPGGAASVEDLGSKNGVRLDGELIGAGPRPLRPGAAVVIGETELTYVDPLAEAGEPGAAVDATAAGAPQPAAARDCPAQAPEAAGTARSRRLAGAALLLAAAAALLALS
ncbi:MAG TPA: FHA domain-containing protein, partial [Anaeromyxobacteraceae bacterium]|nr:FHA domain-containing protein [Anaeromyxobacteraceae bacterium]